MSKPYFHSSIVKIIQNNDFDISNDDLQTLVRTKTQANKVDEGVGDTYFGVLVRRSQLVLESGKNISYMDAVDKAHKGMMPVVQAGAFDHTCETLPTDDEETRTAKRLERNKRTNFARTSATVLRNYIREGGSLSDLDPATAKKSRIEADTRALVKAEAEAQGENTPEAKVAKRLAGLITALNQVNDHDRAALVISVVDAIRKGVK